jgi:hypothetical protein
VDTFRRERGEKLAWAKALNPKIARHGKRVEYTIVEIRHVPNDPYNLAVAYDSI